MPDDGGYVPCCWCFGGSVDFLPIKKTLYCTWGSWSGELVWNNTITEFQPGPIYNAWSGIAEVEVDRWSYNPYTSKCDGPSKVTVPMVVTLMCFDGRMGGQTITANVPALDFGACCIQPDPQTGSEHKQWIGWCAGFNISKYKDHVSCADSFSVSLDISPSCIRMMSGEQCHFDGPNWMAWLWPIGDVMSSTAYVSEV